MPRHLDAAQQLRYDHVDREIIGRVRISVVKWLPGGAHGMCVRRRVLMRTDKQHSATLLAHELVHAEQWHHHGVPGFLARYLAGYASGLARYRQHRLAYLSIPFERDARRRAAAWSRVERSRRPGV